jgi:hypothetical protein
MLKFRIGDRVRICDHSDAHGDLGVIDCIQADGIILVLLDQGCIWPVLMTRVSDLKKSKAKLKPAQHT